MPGQADQAVTATVQRFGRLDVVVANAAIQLHGQDRPVPDLDDEIWERTHAVNLGGTFLTCRAGIRQLLAQGQGGSVVIVWRAINRASRLRLATEAVTGSIMAAAGLSTLLGYVAGLPAVYRWGTTTATGPMAALALLLLNAVMWSTLL